MTTVLAIDAASSEVALALAVDGAIARVRSFPGGQDHSRLLLAEIDELLAGRRKDLEGIAVVRGPGSYAGLRVGIATAQGLAISLGVPVLGIPTLEAVAAAAGLPRVTAIHPAGRGEFAAQRFEDGRALGAIAAFSAELLAGETPLAGEGAGALGGHEIAPAERVRAALIALLPSFAQAQSGKTVDALYLREPNITLPRRPHTAARAD